MLAAGAGRGLGPLAPLCSLEGFGLRHLRDGANRTLPHSCPWGRRYRGMSNHIPKGRKVWSLSSQDLLKPRSVVRVSVATGVNRCNLFDFGAEGIDPLCLPPSLCDARCLKCVQVVLMPGRVAAELSPGSAGCCWKYTIHSQLKEGGEKKKAKQNPPSSCSAAQAGRPSPCMLASKKRGRNNAQTPFLWHGDPPPQGLFAGAVPMGCCARGRWLWLLAAGLRAVSPGQLSLLSGWWGLQHSSPPPGSFALVIKQLNAIPLPASLCNKYQL